MSDIFIRLSARIFNEEFNSIEEKNLHILALTYITQFAHNNTGEFWISVTKLGEMLNVKKVKAFRLLESLEKRGYIKKTGKVKIGNAYYPLYTISLYESQQKIDNQGETVNETVNETVKASNINTQTVASETVNETVNETITNTYITNTELTNTESDIYSPPYNPPSHKLESNDEDFDVSDLFEDETKTEDLENIQIDNLDTNPVTPQEVVDLWNSLLSGKTKRPISINELTRKELKTLKRQCQKYPTLESWIAYFEKLRESEILWKVPSGWKPNLPWALNDEKRIKVMRGDYIPDTPEQVGKTKAELIRQQNIKAAMIYAERANQGVSFWDSLVCDE